MLDDSRRLDDRVQNGGADRRDGPALKLQRKTMMKRWLLIALGAVVLLLGVSGIGGYNRLVGLDQAVRAQWGQVENVYQRRADLVPNLVETVKGAAAFEKETFSAVAAARAQVGQVTAAGMQKVIADPEAFRRFQQAQDGLSSALSRLMVVTERYPELKATSAFRDLQAQLEGTENRITVERMRFNEAAQAFNTKRQSFPTVIIAGLFGGRFAEKTYFQARAGAELAPQVKF
jgi:LemA protein